MFFYYSNEKDRVWIFNIKILYCLIFQFESYSFPKIHNLLNHLFFRLIMIHYIFCFEAKKLIEK